MPKVTLPPAWTAVGARFDVDGLLYLPEWRRGFTVHELRAMFYQCQQVRALAAQVRQRDRDAEILDLKFDELQRRCAFYRRQLVLESQLGLALARVAG
jgi:hypothetical protein